MDVVSLLWKTMQHASLADVSHLLTLKPLTLSQFDASTLPQNPGHLCCWNDSEPFTGTIYSYATRLDSDQQRYTIEGIFCHPACVKQYMLDHGLNETLLDLFHRLCVEVYRCSHIYPKGSPLVLQKFSGPQGLTIQQYRAQHHIYRVLPGHMVDRSCVHAPVHAMVLPLPVTTTTTE
jgi:hypothetical protein